MVFCTRVAAGWHLLSTARAPETKTHPALTPVKPTHATGFPVSAVLLHMLYMTGMSATSVHEDIGSPDVSDMPQVSLSAFPRAVLSWIFEHLDARNVTIASQVRLE